MIRLWACGRASVSLRSIAAMIVLLLLVEATSVQAAGPSRQADARIVDLMLCYARGTDAIGDSTRADPAWDGAAIYARCFEDDAVFRLWIPGSDFSDPAAAVTVGPTPLQSGPEAWAEFVFGAFDGTYTFTQHSVSNFVVDVTGRTGTLTAYLNAAHVRQEGGVVVGVDVAHGTYTLQVEKRRGAWRVKALGLKLINFTPFNP